MALGTEGGGDDDCGGVGVVAAGGDGEAGGIAEGDETGAGDVDAIRLVANSNMANFNVLS